MANEFIKSAGSVAKGALEGWTVEGRLWYIAGGKGHMGSWSLCYESRVTKVGDRTLQILDAKDNLLMVRDCVRTVRNIFRTF